MGTRPRHLRATLWPHGIHRDWPSAWTGGRSKAGGRGGLTADPDPPEPRGTWTHSPPRSAQVTADRGPVGRQCPQTHSTWSDLGGPPQGAPRHGQLPASWGTRRRPAAPVPAALPSSAWPGPEDSKGSCKALACLLAFCEVGTRHGGRGLGPSRTGPHPSSSETPCLHYVTMAQTAAGRARGGIKPLPGAPVCHRAGVPQGRCLQCWLLHFRSSSSLTCLGEQHRGT